MMPFINDRIFNGIGSLGPVSLMMICQAASYNLTGAASSLQDAS